MAAAKARTKIPWWAMSVVGLLPLWVLLYAWALKPSEETVAGRSVRARRSTLCSSCHGASGAGGVGRPLHNGEVLLTFPTFEQQASFVYTGSAPFAGKVYGDPDRPGGRTPAGRSTAASCPSKARSSAGR